MSINLVLADGHPIVLTGLTHLLSAEADFAVQAACGDGEQALRALHRYQPDILLLDLELPKLDGLAVLRRMQREQLPTRPVVFCATVDEDSVLEAIRLGARGVVLKEMPNRLLLQCLHKVHAGGEWLERRSVRLALDKLLRRESELDKVQRLLTVREMELLRLVVNGHSNREIASELCISEGTAKVHLHRIYKKLGVKSRTALTRYVRDNRLI